MFFLSSNYKKDTAMYGIVDYPIVKNENANTPSIYEYIIC
jgi:hypothetical protein